MVVHLSQNKHAKYNTLDKYLLPKLGKAGMELFPKWCINSLPSKGNIAIFFMWFIDIHIGVGQLLSMLILELYSLSMLIIKLWTEMLLRISSFHNNILADNKENDSLKELNAGRNLPMKVPALLSQ